MSYWEQLRDDTEVGFTDNIPFNGFFARDVAEMSDYAYIYFFEMKDDKGKNLMFGPCRWMSRDDHSLPSEDDACLAVRDSDKEWWVIAWWPKEFDS